MPNYTSIQNHCQNIQRLSSTVIDDFLIYFAAQQDKLNREAERELAKYKHITKQLPEAWYNMTLSQYIAHRVFRKGGLINKYIHHSGLNHRTDEEIDFLKFQKDHPWRFSFAEITGFPENDFYEMYDVFTDEEYLIYSPGMTDIRYTQNPCLWFNLIAYNGKCWQTFFIPIQKMVYNLFGGSKRLTIRIPQHIFKSVTITASRSVFTGSGI